MIRNFSMLPFRLWHTIHNVCVYVCKVFTVVKLNVSPFIKIVKLQKSLLGEHGYQCNISEEVA